MPSSTSPSDPEPGSRHAPPPGLRLTASNRPGVAQPVPERDIPDQPWKAIALAVLVLTVVLTGLWEWRMRGLGLTPGHLADGPSAWAEQRRRVRAEPGSVVIVGDSRILFDTDMDRFEQLTGQRPIQLALQGTNGRPFLEDLADDPHFTGLAIVGIKELSYFRKETGLNAEALKHGRWESPADRGSYLVRKAVTHHLGMLENDYHMSKMVLRLDPGLRPGAPAPRADPWKLVEIYDNRQAHLWTRLETDGRMRGEAAAVWMQMLAHRPPVAPDVIAFTQARTRAAVAKIRARGGEVVFVRPPAASPMLEREEALLPRAKGWEPLMKAASVKGVHFQDIPNAQGLWAPELSHLSQACATVFTDAYVRRLAELTPRLKLRADAPPVMHPADCQPKG
jgi:hypothetical protein